MGLDAVDWHIFMNATRAFWQGADPYIVGTGLNKVYVPFWTYILLGVFVWLPDALGQIVFFSTGLLLFAYTAIRMQARPYQMVLFLLSRSVVGCLYYGNIDWLVTAGFWMPPWLGLFFVTMKPQVGLGMAIFWGYASYKEGGVWQVIKTFAPVTLMYGISFVWFGDWTGYWKAMEWSPANASVFPWAVPTGLFCIGTALWVSQYRLAILGTPFLAPYVTLYNLSSTMLATVPYPKAFIAIWIILWMPVVLRYFL